MQAISTPARRAQDTSVGMGSFSLLCVEYNGRSQSHSTRISTDDTTRAIRSRSPGHCPGDRALASGNAVLGPGLIRGSKPPPGLRGGKFGPTHHRYFPPPRSRDGALPSTLKTSRHGDITGNTESEPLAHGLWLNSDFRKLWGSLTIVHFGGQVTFLALPLTAALMLNASPFEVGVLTALEALPYPLFGLFAGGAGGSHAQAARHHRVRRGSWPCVGRDPRVRVGGALSMTVLYIVGFLIGLLTVIGWPAYQVFMTERVGRDNLVEANTKIGLADSAAQLMGPGMAGALIQWLTAPFALLFDATCFFFSAWMLRGIPPAASDEPKAIARSVREEIYEGLRAVWHTGSCARSCGPSARGRSAATRSSPSWCSMPRASSISPRATWRALHDLGPGFIRRGKCHRAIERALRHGANDARRASRERGSHGS